MNKLDTKEILLLKKFLKHSDMAISDNDLPLSKIVIEAAKKFHKRSAYRLLIALQKFLQKGQTPPPELTQYILDCIANIDSEEYDLNQAFNFKRHGGGRYPIQDLEEKLSITKAVKQLRDVGETREEAFDTLAKEFAMSSSKIKTIYDSHKGILDEILQEEKLIQELFTDRGMVHKKL